MIPRIDPIAAPIRRRRLARLSRISNRMTATEKVRPTIAAVLELKPKGREGEQAATETAAKNSRTSAMSHQPPTPPSGSELRSADFGGAKSPPPGPPGRAGGVI